MSSDKQVSEAQDWQKVDPWPDIPAALLSSADIHKYVELTKMIDLFDPKQLKSASYAVGIGGQCVYWTGRGKKITRNLYREGQTFTLPPNAIAFVELLPKFKLPDYMAVRFNLSIKYIYRGLLLGTGPLVDPGFEGKIYVPLHNLTGNYYYFHYDEKLVWLEFTKTSRADKSKASCGQSPIPSPDAQFIRFEKKKKNLDLYEYLRSATGGDPVISSIPYALRKAERLLNETEDQAKLVRSVGFAAALGVVIGLFTLILALFRMQETYLDEVRTLRAEVDEMHSQQLDLDEMRSLQSRLDNAHSQTAAAIEQAEQRLSAIEAELEALRAVAGSPQ